MVTRSEIEAAKQQVETTKSQLSESASQVKSSQQQVSEALRKVTPRKRVPFTPRKERVATRKYKKTLGKTRAELSQAEKDIAAAQAEVTQYETGILQPAESALKKYEIESAAYDRALKIFNDGHAGEYLAFMRTRDYSGDKRTEVAAIRGYLKKLVKMQRAGQIFPTDTILGKQRLAEAAKAKQEITRLSKELGIKFQGWEKTAQLINEKLGQGYTQLDKPLAAYYDPKTGQEIFQSMDPSIAKKMGYIEVKATAFNPKTGKYIVESPTGLLTESQLAYKKILDTLKQQSTKLPTSFEFGGVKETPAADVQSLLQPTSYQAALRAPAYTGARERAVEYSRLGPEKFYEKYGYSVTPEGQVLYSGTVTPVTAEDIITLFGGARAAKVGATVVKKAATSAGILFSDLIAPQVTRGVEKVPTALGLKEEGIPAQILRGGLYAGSAAIPSVGEAYATELLTGLSAQPVETATGLWEYARERPFEVGTMATLGFARARRYKLDQKAVKAVESNLGKLSEAKLTDLTLIRKGAGLRTGADRIAIEGIQELDNAVRRIKIEGDLLKQGEKIYFIPDAQGFATTITVVKPSKFAAPRIYQDVQRFEVGGRSTGINLGNIGNVQLFTPLGYSTYVPIKSSAAIIKRKFGPLAEARTLREIARRLEADPQYGGQVVKDITLPFEDLGFKINEQVSLLTGSRGESLILTTKEAGETFGARGRGAKQPYKGTMLEEPTQVQQKIIPTEKVSRNIAKQSENLVSSLVPTAERSLVGVPRMVGGEGLTEQQLARSAGFSDFLVSYESAPLAKGIKATDAVQSATSLMIGQEIKSETKAQQLERQKLIEKQKLLQKQRLKEQQKMMERQRLLEKQRQVARQKQLQKQTNAFESVIGVPISPTMGEIFEFGFEPPKRRKARTKPEVKKKKKKKERKVLPTLSQQILGINLGRKVERPTGFEIARV